MPFVPFIQQSTDEKGFQRRNSERKAPGDQERGEKAETATPRRRKGRREGGKVEGAMTQRREEEGR